MTAAINDLPFLWIPVVLVCTAAAVAWIAAAVELSHAQRRPLQFCATLLGCAHFLNAARAVLYGIGAVAVDPAQAVFQIVTAATCCAAAVCVWREFFDRRRAAADPDPIPAPQSRPTPELETVHALVVRGRGR